MNSSELIKIIENNDIAIYGAGYAAENFYTALKIQNLDCKVKCFLVSKALRENSYIKGVPIKTFEDEINVVKKHNIYICIAVHESIKNEIEEFLLKHNIKKYVWVHPYIFDLVFGRPKMYHVARKPKKIVRCQESINYAFAIRYLVIENYYNTNSIGYDLYLKALCLQCEKKTAYKRLYNFIRLIKDWDINGYQDQYSIMIDEKNRLIDGTHRLTLACYHEIDEIYCDIYSYSTYYYQVVKETHLLSMNILKENNFKQSELNAIVNVQNIIMGEA